jgi:hypothetical protein
LINLPTGRGKWATLKCPPPVRKGGETQYLDHSGAGGIGKTYLLNLPGNIGEDTVIYKRYTITLKEIDVRGGDIFI